MTYTGSLTTPPCVENIIYVINRNRLPVSAYQIQNYVNLLGLP
jgi:carbonic anhydrase